MALSLEKLQFSKSDIEFNHFNSLSYSKLSAQTTIINRKSTDPKNSLIADRVTFINMPTITHLR